MRQNSLSFYETDSAGSPVSIVSIPLELGSDERGLAAAPRYLYDHGLEYMLSGIGREIRERRNIFCQRPRGEVSSGAMKHVEEIVSTATRAKVATEKALRRGDTVLALGGDHTAAIGPIAGGAAVFENIGLIYIDAHPDCTTHETTISGNVHGMIVSSAIGCGHPMLTDLFSKKIKPENVLYLGIKDIDKGELELIREQGIAYFTMLDIALNGLSPVVRAIDSLAQRCNKTWVSLDLDSIDEQYAPGVAMTTSGGLTRREITALAHYIGRVCSVVGIDIAEMLPAKDRDGMTAHLVCELLARFLGGSWGWYENYMEHYAEINVTGEREKVQAIRKT